LTRGIPQGVGRGQQTAVRFGLRHAHRLHEPGDQQAVLPGGDRLAAGAVAANRREGQGDPLTLHRGGVAFGSRRPGRQPSAPRQAEAMRAGTLARAWCFGLCLLATGGLPAKALDLQGTIWEEGARSAGVADPLLLYAISLVEAGRRSPGGELAPWPWTVRTPEGPVFAASREAGVEVLRRVPRDSNTDVGLMQVNLRANGHLAPSPEALLDPKKNIRVAATILRRALDSAPFDPVLGVGRYHSWTEARARSYGEAVWATYYGLAGIRQAHERGARR
jgi:hypothetical protein